jgi:cytosine/adenosine deaminase-related metal-dependent hydrolase
MIVRAAWILTMAGPPLADGAIRIRDGCIEQVAPWKAMRRSARETVIDLGQALVLPGLLNAHCHLDYTDMAGMLPPQRQFTDWIKLITSAKAEWSLDDFRRSWLHGAAMLLRSGTTTVADVEAIPDLLPDCWARTPLRIFSFLEMTGIRARKEPRQVLAEAEAVLHRLPQGRCRAGLSPHAPYSTRPALLTLVANRARSHGLRVTIHVAESEEEYQMFRHARGPMFDWLLRNERDMSDCGGITPVQHLHRTGLLGPHLLAVHANYLGPGDASLLARHSVTVVHCPRSHRYFGHRPFPWRRLLRAGVNLCLGTDSLATVLKQGRHPPELSLFEELHEVRTRQPWLGPQRLLRMVTVNPARALGLEGQAGQIIPGAWADLTALPAAGVRFARDAWHAAAEHRGPVLAAFIAGIQVWPAADPVPSRSTLTPS